MEQMQNSVVRTHEELRNEPNYINLEPALPGGGTTFQTISAYGDPTQLINSNYHIHPANYYTIEQINTIPPAQNHYGQPPDIQQQQQQQQFPTDHGMMNDMAGEDLKSDDDLNKEKLRKLKFFYCAIVKCKLTFNFNCLYISLITRISTKPTHSSFHARVTDPAADDGHRK